MLTQKTLNSVEEYTDFTILKRSLIFQIVLELLSESFDAYTHTHTLFFTQMKSRCNQIKLFPQGPLQSGATFKRKQAQVLPPKTS